MTANTDTRPLRDVLISLNPRDGRECGQVPATSPEELDHMLVAAGAAFEAEQRRRGFDDGRLLTALADAVERAEAELIRVADEETGLGAERLRNEIARTLYQLRAFADLAGSAGLIEPVIDTADPHRVPPRLDQRRLNVPIGPVAVFAASNFPFAFGILGGDTASALAAGCPVVVKGHTAQPRLGAALARLVPDALAAAQAPAEWIQVVLGGGHGAGHRMVSHPAVQAVGFTGSNSGGTALFRTAAEREYPIPVYAEMGSLNPAFVAPHAARARVEEIARGWAGCLTASAGQLCTKPGLLVLPDRDSADQVARLAAQHVEAAAVPPMLAPRLQDGFQDALRAASEVEGVRWASRPVSEDARPGTWQPAAVLTVDAATVLAQPRLLEEMFGPAGIVVAAADADQALRLAHALSGTLTATVHADAGDQEWAEEMLAVLRQRAGRIVVNGWSTGLSVGWATVHGGPWPATSAPHTTSVGMAAAHRFVRPVAYQGVPDTLLPPALRDANPLGLSRLIDGAHSSSALS